MQTENSLIDFALFSHISCCAKARLWVSQEKRKRVKKNKKQTTLLYLHYTIK